MKGNKSIILVDDDLISKVSDEAKNSPRLRMNYNFHKSLEDKCQRLLNALEPGTILPIHKHDVDEMWIVLTGKLRLNIHDNNQNITDSYILTPKEEKFGVNIPADTWHSLESLESGTVIVEVKEGPYKPIK